MTHLPRAAFQSSRRVGSTNCEKSDPEGAAPDADDGDPRPFVLSEPSGCVPSHGIRNRKCINRRIYTPLRVPLALVARKALSLVFGDRFPLARMVSA